MDMMDNTMQGFDEALAEEKEPKEDKIVDITAGKPKRRPYCTWTVKGETYKLRLTGAVISRLEGTFRRNLLHVLTDDGLPPLSTMLTVIQAAMQQYHHNIKYRDVNSMYDDYVDEGGDQTMLYADVIMELLAVSGFFTQNQEELLKEELNSLD